MKEILDKYKDIIKRYEIAAWDNEPTAYRFKINRIYDFMVLLA